MSPATSTSRREAQSRPRRHRRRGNDGRPKSLESIVSFVAGMYGEEIDWGVECREVGGPR